MTTAAGEQGSFARHVTKHFAERLAKSQDVSEVLSSKVRAGAVWICAFAADLDDADDLAIQQNRRADHLLDRSRGIRSELHTFENGGVPRGSEIVFDFGPALTGGTRGEGRIAGERNKADVFQGFWNQKVEVTPARGNREDGYFIVLDTEVFGDFFRRQKEKRPVRPLLPHRGHWRCAPSPTPSSLSRSW